MAIQQPDSLATRMTQDGAEAVVVKDSKPKHPYQVLRSLPIDATPAQQDSAIQATFQPNEIHYSNRPDTLHLPGHDVGKSIKDIRLPKYYKEIFFSKDSLLHPELNGGRYGMAGDPVPYSMKNDDIITGLLLGCLVIALISFAQSRRFIALQLKHFFYTPRSETGIMKETSAEMKFQLFMLLQTSLTLSLVYFFYTRTYEGDAFILKSQYHLIAIYFGVLVTYYAVKALLYKCVNWIFFEKKANEQWIVSQLFITGMLGVMLFPVVLLLAYFDLPIDKAVKYVITVIVVTKMLSFYKCYSIFFRRLEAFLQIILYFCTLELIPLLSLWGVLQLIGNYLKINI